MQLDDFSPQHVEVRGKYKGQQLHLANDGAPTGMWEANVDLFQREGLSLPSGTGPGPTCSRPRRRSPSATPARRELARLGPAGVGLLDLERRRRLLDARTGGGW